jgi:hypothetical protein
MINGLTSLPGGVVLITHYTAEKLEIEVFFYIRQKFRHVVNIIDFSLFCNDGGIHISLAVKMPAFSSRKFEKVTLVFS